MVQFRWRSLILALALLVLTAPAALARGLAQGEVARETIPVLWWIAPIGSLIALAAAFWFYQSVMKLEEGTPQMIEIAQAVREGAMAYLKRQYRVVGIIFLILFLIFLVMALFGIQNKIIPFAFLTGGFFSGLCGFIGLKTATNASARTTNAARKSLNSGLQVAFRAGAVMGLVVVGFALLDLSAWFLILYRIPFFGEVLGGGNILPQVTVVMLSFGMGASTQALFARVGGGIYTKAADVGADLVGKVEAGIPEDDPRNPATIADNVGDNVGDVAGMGADLYESYAGSILATAALGVAAVATQAAADPGFLKGMSVVSMQLRYLAAPMVLAGVGVVLSIIGILLVRTNEEATMRQLMKALNRGINVSSVLILLAAIPVIYALGLNRPVQLIIAVALGLAVGILIGKATEFYTSNDYKPTQEIAQQSETGPATVIIAGLAVGMESTGVPVAAIAVSIALSFYLAGGAENTLLGLYAIGLSAVSMLSTLGITLATDAYGPIADNAGGNAEMSHLPKEVRQRTDQLDAVGNTTAATGKGFAIGSAALTALALLAAYLEEIRFALVHLRGITELSINGQLIPVNEMTMADFMAYYNVNLLNPSVLIGLFIGALTVFVFCSLTMKAVGRAAGAMVQEVRRQFREHPGIMAGTEKPDYARCVAISTAGAQREMVVPAMLAIVIPVVIGVLFGVGGVMGLLAGGLSTGFAVAIMMANAGGAWDNAKKYVEQGHLGGKGSEPHKATVVGDTVGDPFKDTSGPSLNILIKLMSMVAVVFAGLIVLVGGGGGLITILFG